MGKPPSVSIVIPAYNQAPYLELAIESVLAQGYSNLELVVIDDGSTDATAEVMRRFAGRAICMSQANIGQAATLNKGWALCRGEFLGYLSSDDVLLPGALQTMIDALERAPETCVAYPDYELIDARGSVVRVVLAQDFSLAKLTEDLICLPGPGAIFRREVFDRLGGWRTDLRLVPDFEFWLRAAKLGPFLRVPQVVAQYRVHDGSASFRPASIEAAGEIIRAVESYWLGAESPAAVHARSNAYLVSAKTHAISGRWSHMVRAAVHAIRLRPSAMMEWHAWHVVLSGVFRKLQQQLQRFQSAPGA